jgi:hypothetical protein
LGDCLLGKFILITEATRIFALLFSTVKVMDQFCAKNGLGCILGDFFANSSGHPG